jgi:class 3 adenylate cyclase
MFADISGFAAMSVKMSTEEVTKVMDDCFRMMGSIIEKHEGTVDKYI